MVGLLLQKLDYKEVEQQQGCKVESRQQTHFLQGWDDMEVSLLAVPQHLSSNPVFGLDVFQLFIVSEYKTKHGQT
jgi:hypothetical protein